jgi:hypothetical protein
MRIPPSQPSVKAAIRAPGTSVDPGIAVELIALPRLSAWCQTIDTYKRVLGFSLVAEQGFRLRALGHSSIGG